VKQERFWNSAREPGYYYNDTIKNTARNKRGKNIKRGKRGSEKHLGIRYTRKRSQRGGQQQTGRTQLVRQEREIRRLRRGVVLRLQEPGDLFPIRLNLQVEQSQKEP